MTFVGQVAIGAGLTTLYYPVAYAKVLIQLGHEPLQPRLSTTLLGNRAYMYPNVFKYIGHIYRTDGFFGLYRGLGCKLISFAVCNGVTNSLQERLSGKSIYQKDYEEAPEIDDIDIELDDISTVIRDTAYETISRCAGIICSQPFYVISLRSIAQFVGRETRFSSIFSAVPDIWKNEGILGFFAGLVPRLVCEALTIVIANFLSHALYSVIVNVNQQPKDAIKGYLGLMSQLVAGQITYPINLTSVVMAVSPSKLQAVSPPNMPVYDSWLACLGHLKDESQTKRGSSLFFRKYMGPRIYTSGIVMPPIEHQK